MLRRLSINLNLNNQILLNVRHGHVLRGKPPGVARTLEQRLAEENTTDPELTERVNIGFAQLRMPRSQQLKERLAHLKALRSNTELEKQARSRNLLIDLEQVHKDYSQTKGHFDLKTIADHYNIFSDLFGQAYFVPRINLDIKYELEDVDVPVYNGNVIKPVEAQSQPKVVFDGKIDPLTGKPSTTDSYWSLLVTNPDGQLNEGSDEHVHWFVANIPNGDVEKGDVIANYLPPFPAKGVGYQRMIFVLYKQNGKIAFDDYKLNEKNQNFDLQKRTFKTLDFYRKYQDEMTPAGLAFYQTSWDESVTKFYHNVLDRKEPIFEYDFPKAYLADQKFHPLRQPFNLYLDKHRDPKDVNKRIVEAKLNETHPFSGPPAKLRFPAAHPLRNIPSWQKTEIRKQRLNIGRYADFE